MQFKKNRAILSAVLAAGMASSALMSVTASAERTKPEKYGTDTYAARFMSMYNDVITNGVENGYLDEDTLEAIYEAVGTDKELWFVNDRTPRDWCTANNDLLASFAAEHENVGVIDWYGTSVGHDGYLGADGMRLTSAGADAYADAVYASVSFGQ